jgi:hypothetical protein
MLNFQSLMFENQSIRLDKTSRKIIKFRENSVVVVQRCVFIDYFPEQV